MGAHAAPARHRRALPRGTADDRHTMSWALPAGLAFVYGLYAGFLERGDGPTHWGDFWFGLVSGVVFGVLAYTLGRYQRALPRELRALAYGVLGGGSIGFLHSTAGGYSVLSSSVLGLIVGAAIGGAAFYAFYVHE
ncbi:hypothetical protein I3F58_21890 [Streptomyces sp. MUM 203J]|uniref:hypothetical protein n=1 Tax=Streptomyces sp. MUM 203J TaxID=2791990 RepID=UPI001F03CDD1|nr:hypothetical protein [Streptomyces sp. MUM 203J]MCH0542155.1 hypothetical protein [Streptomyces sp. MUM 203J]